MPSDTGVVANVGVGSWIERRARTHPDRIALIAADRSVTYDEFASRVRRLANASRRLGVERPWGRGVGVVAADGEVREFAG